MQLALAREASASADGRPTRVVELRPPGRAVVAAMTKATRVVAYLRVSTEKQAEAGVSLEAQRAKVEAYAALYELELAEVVVDAAVSAKTQQRAGDRASRPAA